MPTANVNISEQQVKFIKQAIKRGRFQNTSEVVRAGLHLLEEQSKLEKARLDRMLKMAEVGFDEIASGKYVELKSEDDIDAYISKLSKSTRRKRKAS